MTTEVRELEEQIQRTMHEWYLLKLMQERGWLYCGGAAEKRIAALEQCLDRLWDQHEQMVAS